MHITIGQQAPDFILYSDEKQKIVLSEQKGKNILLLFFPFAFTSTCTKELCATRDDIAFYNDMNATVYGISVDSYYTLAVYKKEQHINFSLLSDFNKQASLAYHTLYENFGFDLKGVAKRSAFVIDKHGKVQYAEVLENAGEIPDFDAIKKVLTSLQ